MLELKDALALVAQYAPKHTMVSSRYWEDDAKFMFGFVRDDGELSSCPNVIVDKATRELEIPSVYEACELSTQMQVKHG